MLLKGESRGQRTKMLQKVPNSVTVETADRFLIKKTKNNMRSNFHGESVQESQMLRMKGWITGNFSA